MYLLYCSNSFQLWTWVSLPISFKYLTYVIFLSSLKKFSYAFCRVVLLDNNLYVLYVRKPLFLHL